MGVIKLDGKTAIVTGAAKGLGKSMSIGLAKEGAIVLICDIDVNEAKKTAEEIVNMGLIAKAVKMDVSNKTDIENAVREILNEWGKIDILVNNAGIVGRTNIFDTTEQEIDRILNINLKGVIFCSQIVAKSMIENKYGKIVNIASVAAKIGGGLFGTSIYAASKGGVISLTKGYAKELAPYGITVNAIAPGSIDTPLTTNGRTEEDLRNSAKKIPLGRRGRSEELEGAAVFLASDESSFITGATIDVNGGTLMD